MAQILLINPSYLASYGGNKLSVINPIFPTLSLATIAGAAQQRGHKVKIMDMSMVPYNYEDVESEIRSYKPDIIGMTGLTPNMNQIRDISVLTKDISEEILVVAGGIHPTSMPLETLKELPGECRDSVQGH